MNAFFRVLLIVAACMWYVMFSLLITAYPKAVWPVLIISLTMFTWFGSIWERIK